MNAYKQAVKKHLHCGGARKKELMSTFDASLSAFAEEQNSPSYDQAVAAFGPPETMARVLMEQVPEREIRQYRTHKKLLKSLACLCAAAFIAFSLYIFYWKQVTIITVEGEVFEGTIPVSQEGE